MRKNQKRYDAKLKAKVALASLKGDKTLLEICTENNISKSSAIEWRETLYKEASALFIPFCEREKKEKALKYRVESLLKTVGEMKMETDFLKKKLSQ